MRAAVLVSAVGAAFAAVAPWQNDTVLNALAARYWSQQLVVSPTDLAALDQLVATCLPLFTPNCTWSDIDYAGTGTAFWPAINHTARTRAMATAVISAGSAYFNSSKIQQQAYCALSWWLASDPQNPNWWYMDIGAPGYVAPTAFMLWDSLKDDQIPQLNKILSRANYKSYTGANLVWLAGNVAWRGLLNGNRSETAAAINAALGTIVVTPGTQEGIKADGAFFQHGNQLYNGGYGQSFAYDITNLLALVANTTLAATEDEINTFSQFLLNGSLRMIFYGRPSPDGSQGPAMWDSAVIGRDVSRPYGAFLQFGFGQSGQQVSWVASALAGIGGQYGAQLQEYAARLNGSVVGPPSGGLGHRHFWIADYAVKTTPTWMASIRMQSSRTLRCECVNSENVQGLHLADGAMYVYKSGYEYSEISPEWDWERLPGTTVKVGAVQLDCNNVQGGSSNAFTGGVSDGSNGLALQDFTAPLNAGLSLLRHVAFQNDSLAVSLANITSFKTSVAGNNLTVATTIDSVRLDVAGGVWWGTLGSAAAPQQLPPGKHTWAPGSAGAPQWLWHNGTGYVMSSFARQQSPAVLIADVNPDSTGFWGVIGPETPYGNVSIPLFTLSLEIAPGAAAGVPAVYTVVPAIALDDFSTAVAASGDAFGVSAPGENWIASWRSTSSGPLYASVFAGTNVTINSGSGSFPAVTVGAAGAYIVSFTDASVAVSVANPLQTPWTTSVSVAGTTFQPSSSSGYTCSGSTITFSAPPSDGSAFTATCEF